MKKGDVVIIYTSNYYESLVMTLAAARLGLVHHIVQHTDPPKELAVKINYLEPKLIFTTLKIFNDDGSVHRIMDIIEETNNYIE